MLQREHLEEYSFKTGAPESLLEQMVAEAAAPSHADDSRDALLTTIQARPGSVPALPLACLAAQCAVQSPAVAGCIDSPPGTCRTAASAGLCGREGRGCTSRCWLRCMLIDTARLS